jgi:hypothetical protein
MVRRGILVKSARCEIEKRCNENSAVDHWTAFVKGEVPNVYIESGS